MFVGGALAPTGYRSQSQPHKTRVLIGAICYIATVSDRILLVLDLDETLVHATEASLAHEPNFTLAQYHVYCRPHLDVFLRFAHEHFDVGVWTSSTPAYADGICSTIFANHRPPTFVWASDRCTLKRDVELDHWSKAKHLAKLKRHGYRLERVLAIDDSPEKHRRNYGNLIRVNPYHGEQFDDELLHLMNYLTGLRDATNVREIEKRHWRGNASPQYGNER